MSSNQGRTARIRRSGVGACLAIAAGAGIGPVATVSAAASSADLARYYRLVQYPGAGFGGLKAQIVRSRRSIDMEMYEIADPTIERDLGAAASRGLRVRVLVDGAFHGTEVNGGAVRYLAAHGVEVKRAPRGYIFHIKATSFDHTVSDISTANLVAKYYRTSRDAEIIDSNPVQVRAIEGTFARDWAAGSSGDPSEQTVQAPGLIWSPNTGLGTAENALVKQIGAAQTAVNFTSEELSDPAIYGALSTDAERGVTCRVVMTRSSDWDTAFRQLTKAGCQVHLFSDSSSALYIHEKLVLDDPGQPDESMFLGSQNASVTSLTRNRELGVVLTGSNGGADPIHDASATFNADFANSTAWATPTPTPSPAPPPAPVSCSPVASSGNCYEPGEDCSDADHGMTGIAGDGKSIKCEYNNGWRWEPQ